ncbi:MAG: acetate--CoA ligase family protein [Methylobacteriaceae bacterium]|nr:acetate--CoA ligase family protein [Methylobacteriaceae bacterium]MBV9243179.1 acetate--CoA ligase family protein [Methylobacteriaceae bacterium]
MPKRLERLLRPRSIAVIGGREARAVARECDRMGFAGTIWPIHPRLDEIAGRRCFRSVEELPGAPDAAFVGVNRHATVATVRALAASGAGGAVCYANGFAEAQAETGDGARLEAALVEAAGAMPIIGPNCYGLINYLDGALLWPDQHGGSRVEAGVAVLTQSSNIAVNLTMQQRALPLAYVLTAGNQAQTGLANMAAALLDDPRVTAVGLHIEGFGDLAAFEAFAAKARQLHKPVVVLKVGRSQEARAATLSHTASIAGSDAFTEAFLRRLGVPRVHSIPELLETLNLLHVHGPLPGRNVLSMSCSGGEASLMADTAIGSRLRFPPFSGAAAERVRSLIGGNAAVANPLDYQTFVWADVERLTHAFAAAAAIDVNLALVILDLPRADRCDPADWRCAIEAVKRAAAQSGRRFAVIASMHENLPEAVAIDLATCGIAPMRGIAEALAAADAAATISEAWQGSPAQPVARAPACLAPVCLLDEAESKRRLAAWGVPVPDARLAASAEDAVCAAIELGFPVALKGLGIAHKTEVGAVHLGLRDAGAVRDATRAMAGLDAGFLVERMIEAAVAEFIAGVMRDPQGALMLTLGAGGILVELVEDTATLLLPAASEDIRTAFKSLRAARLLGGYRGRPAGDLDAAVAAAAGLARFALAHADRIEEVEVNPLIVCAEGAFAADALIRLREP